MIFTLSIIAIIYTSLVALAQTDLKKLIAYSSVAHMGFVTLGIFTFTTQGVEGAIFQMLSHGIISAGLFLCVGVIYDRMHTHEIDVFGGLVNRMPIYAAIFMVFTLGNVGLPGTSGFIGEFLTLLAAFKVNTWVAFLATTGVILSAAYSLYVYRRIIYGALVKPALKNIQDVSYREIGILAPLVALTIFFGLHPSPILDVTAVSVKKLVASYEAAVRPAKPRRSTGARARSRCTGDAGASTQVEDRPHERVVRSTRRCCPRSPLRSAPWPSSCSACSRRRARPAPTSPPAGSPSSCSSSPPASSSTAATRARCCSRAPSSATPSAASPSCSSSPAPRWCSSCRSTASPAPSC